MELAQAFVRVRPASKGFGFELTSQVRGEAAQAGDEAGRAFSGGIDKHAKSAAMSLRDVFSVAAVGKIAGDMKNAARDLEQAVGGTAAVFGEAGAAIDTFAKGADQAAGLSERAARELTSQIGGLLQGFGMTQDEAARTSISLAQLGADLAATFGGRPEEAVQALGAALRGETDPLERFGISLNAAAVGAKAVELGLATSATAVDMNARSQAALAIIMERSASAQGQFAREAHTAAGAEAIASAQAENSAASLGKVFLPIYERIVSVVGNLAEAFGMLPGPIQTATVALVGLVALSGPASRLTGTLAGMGRLGGTAATALTHVGVAGAGLYVAAQGARALFDALDRDKVNIDLPALATSLLDLANSGRIGGEAAGAFGDDLDKLGRAINDLADASLADDITHLSEDILSLGGLAGDTGLDKARERIAALDEALVALVSRDPAVAREAFDGLTSALEAQGIPAERLIGLLDGYRGALAGVDLDQRIATQSGSEMEGQMQRNAIAADDARAALQELQEAILGQANEQFAYKSAVDDTNDSMRELEEKTRAVAAASSQELAAAQEDLAESLEKVEGDMIAQADQAVVMAERQAILARATWDEDQAIIVKREELRKLAEGLAPGSPLRRNIEAYIADLQTIPERIHTQITADMPGRVGAGTGGRVAIRAQHGFAGTVTGPTPFIIGEGGEPEDVLVVPHSKGGIGGAVAQGAGGLHLEVHGDLNLGERRTIEDLDWFARTRLGGL